jgi:hypothetical protein
MPAPLASLEGAQGAARRHVGSPGRRRYRPQDFLADYTARNVRIRVILHVDVSRFPAASPLVAASDWMPLLTGQQATTIQSPEQAPNVFDFEAVAGENSPRRTSHS